jgi:hypothetical protein
MYPYKTLSKSQLIELLCIIESTLATAPRRASTAGKEYSTELVSQLAFEVGHLNGSIKSVIQLIGEYAECSK